MRKRVREVKDATCEWEGGCEEYENRGLGTCGSCASVRVISWSTLWREEMSLKWRDGLHH